MITFIYGAIGYGKTTLLLQMLAESTARGVHSLLIVPEQEAVQAERMTLHALPPSSGLVLEVLTFSRLYNRVCREYGGLSYRYVTPAMRRLLMWQNLRELAPLLEEYGDAAQNDPSLSATMLSTVNEFKMCGITPNALESTVVSVSSMPSGAVLSRKLRDLSLIYASFDRLVAERYTDSADDLSRLADMLDKHDFFRGTHVFIDSFTSFTAQEHRVLRRILATAENVTVTFPLPSPLSDALHTKSIVASHGKLRGAAEQCGEVYEKILTKNHRAISPDLAYLSESLWDLQAAPRDEKEAADGSIVLERCENPYAEAEAVAAHVLSLLRQGERCRDIVVILRNPQDYRGVLEPAFEKNGIPLFLSEKTDLCHMAPVQLLLSALRIRKYHWNKRDVIAHLKTGLCDLTPRAADLLEDYIQTWEIGGSSFLDGDWTMNPDGYSSVSTERGRDILKTANDARRTLVEPLLNFFVSLDMAQTMPDLCRAIYAYLEAIGLEGRITELSAKEMARGQKKSAEDLSALYAVILRVLADMAEALPDSEISPDDLDTILQFVFSETSIGTIPTSVDEVTIGSAATLRVSRPKYAFVLGLCEGEFPASVRNDSLLGDSERKTLETLGLEFASDSDMRASDERMYLLRAFSAPSHGLYLFTHDSALGGKSKLPSLGFTRVTKLFPNLPVHRYDSTELSYLSGAPRSAAAHLRELAGTPTGRALYQAISPHIPTLNRYASAQSHEPQASLSEETAASVFGETLSLSFSRFESYVKCPFGYYCSHVLGLRETKKAKFRPQDMGTFVHEILEKTLDFALTEQEDGSFPSREMLEARTEAVVSEFFDRVFPAKEKASARLHHLCDRLKTLSLLVLKNLTAEFSHSHFRPAFFELSLGRKDSTLPPIVFISDDERFRVKFTGVIDRVDLMKKDGEIYVRVVDYKTGSKEFSTEDLRHALNTQMLLYLYSLCLSANGKFVEQIGLEEGKKPIPAGMVYLSTNIPVIEVNEYTSSEKIEEEAEHCLKRSGLLLKDHDVLLAMNDSLSPAFLLSASKDRSGALNDKNLIGSEEFETLFDELRTTILEIAKKMRGGSANATPLRYAQADPCSYCTAKAICRKRPD